MPNHFITSGGVQVVTRIEPSRLILSKQSEKVFLTKTVQGPPGVSWPEPFALAARFSEISSDPTAKAQARANLDLQDIDCGTFN